MAKLPEKTVIELKDIDVVRKHLNRALVYMLCVKEFYPKAHKDANGSPDIYNELREFLGMPEDKN